jgi:hypothetical protein
MSENTSQPGGKDYSMSYFVDGFKAGLEGASYKAPREYVLRLLRRRCGVLTEEVRDHVYALSDKRLDALGEALFTFSSEAALRSWLQADDPTGTHFAPSVIVSSRSAATSLNLCTVPLGQRISINFTVLSPPRPK